MKFADIPGAEAIKKQLIQAARNGQIPHAQLYTGPEGGVALMLALAYAQFINCEQPTDTDSCGLCPACIKISKSIHPDVQYCFPIVKSKSIDDDRLAPFIPLFRSFIGEMPFGTLNDWAEKVNFENRKPFISIKAVKETIQGLHLKAYEARYKIQLIWLPETMREEGANAFLKILEEPPPFTVFLLVSHQPELLLATIISRVQRVQVPALAQEELQLYLVKKMDLETLEAESAAELAEGNISEALHVAQHRENNYHRLFMDWQRACYAFDIDKILRVVEEFTQMTREIQKTFIRFCLSKLRAMLAIREGAAETTHLNAEERKDLSNLGKIVSPTLVETMMTELEEAWDNINQNAAARMVFFDISVRFSQGYYHLKIQAK